MTTPKSTECAPLQTGKQRQLDFFVGVPRVHVRLVKEAMVSYRPRIVIEGPADLAAFLSDYFADRVTEEFLTVNLTTSNTIINVAVLSRGGLSSAIVEPRSVFQAAILANAAAVILAHQHPSHNPEPSKADLQITKQLVAAGKLMGIPVHDHVIIAGDTFTSLAERGLMNADVSQWEGVMVNDPASPKDDRIRKVQMKRGDDMLIIYLPDAPQAKWKRQPQEQEGDYWFGGQLYITQGVAAELSQAEILWIVADLQEAVAVEAGLDYLQTYQSEDGRRVWLIDQLSKAQLEGDVYSAKEKRNHHYFTMLLPSEY